MEETDKFIKNALFAFWLPLCTLVIVALLITKTDITVKKGIETDWNLLKYESLVVLKLNEEREVIAHHIWDGNGAVYLNENRCVEKYSFGHGYTAFECEDRIYAVGESSEDIMTYFKGYFKFKKEN